MMVLGPVKNTGLRCCLKYVCLSIYLFAGLRSCLKCVCLFVFCLLICFLVFISLNGGLRCCLKIYGASEIFFSDFIEGFYFL